MYRLVIKRLHLLRRTLFLACPLSPSLVRSSFWTLSRFACGNSARVIFAALLAPSLTSLSSVYPRPYFSPFHRASSPTRLLSSLFLLDLSSDVAESSLTFSPGCFFLAALLVNLFRRRPGPVVVFSR